MIQVGRAQTKTVDSLRRVLARHPQADTFRANRLNDLAYALPGSVGEKGFDSLKIVQREVVLNQALKLSQQLKYPYGQAVALRYKSRIVPECNECRYPFLTDADVSDQ